MAYMNQEKKKVIAAALKPVLNKYGIKATLSVNNHSTIVLNIKMGHIDFFGNNGAKEGDYIDVNPYHYQNHFSGKALAFLKEAFNALNTGNHDNSDIQTDYFDVGWYVDVNIGQWNKPYTLLK